MNSPVTVTGTLAHATPETAPLVKGRREFFRYQDLMVAQATEGRMRAQVMSASRGMSQPTGWHYHVCEAQFVYALKGWVDLEFEDGRRIRLQAGESLLIPGGLRHNETATSDEFELLEVSVPGELGTVPCDPPSHLA
ncbi:MAG: cupin domain-containing protein [Burkholderiales bacterium]|jgi:mannose-6-phosphate isomerase-like protein (cupin superfamily)